ncbi:MAG: hypothetical protein ACLP01_17295 [Solirubrobacteraceae bacterium]
MATISSLLADHVTLQVRSVDRLFLQGYVPNLMTEGQVIRFLLDRGFPIPSPAVLGKIGRDYVNQINAFIAENEIPTVKFVKGDVKEDIARKHFEAAERDGRYGVVMVGIAQEKTSAWRGWRDGGPDGHLNNCRDWEGFGRAWRSYVHHVGCDGRRVRDSRAVADR